MQQPSNKHESDLTRVRDRERETRRRNGEAPVHDFVGRLGEQKHEEQFFGEFLCQCC